MAVTLTYPDILSMFPEHLAPKRSESASFLIWYLENYYRLDTQEATDSVCDQRGDKGVDGIFVNDGDQTITVFQSRISQSDASTIGDTGLKEFVGTLAQFLTAKKIFALAASAGNAQVAALITRLDLTAKIGTYELRGEFLSNIEMDANGASFLSDHAPNVRFIGRGLLQQTYISNVRTIPSRAPRSFDITDFRITEYIVDANARAVVAPVKAKELVALDGIADQSLYAHNVRGPLGMTGVNKDIVKSIRDKSLHKTFPLFHNGITVIAKTLDVPLDAKSITIGDYYVVNGCQSLTALFQNASALSDELRILTKFIKADGSSPLAKQITDYSNNQNGVKARDFVANNPIQIRLQNEVAALYGAEYALEIKRGEVAPANTRVLSNENVGLQLLAFDLQEPWATHRKYQVFDDKYSDIFGRPEVTADRIIMCDAIMQAVAAALPRLENKLLEKYGRAAGFLFSVNGQILESDPTGRSVLSTPDQFVRDGQERAKFVRCITNILLEVAIDLNLDSRDWDEDFDYRGKLRDETWVKERSKSLVADHLKQVQRGKCPSFGSAWLAP